LLLSLGEIVRPGQQGAPVLVQWVIFASATPGGLALESLSATGGLLRVWLTSSLFRWGGAGKDIDHAEVVFRAVQS
ncbi:hypothetical protein, partial [Corynebacterium belfantii]|uniref:hypothetical protein n=1 Tax=Corynebacterium belfantii TaxID=2014537 RepID=UPI001A7E35E5